MDQEERWRYLSFSTTQQIGMVSFYHQWGGGIATLWLVLFHITLEFLFFFIFFISFAYGLQSNVST